MFLIFLVQFQELPIVKKKKLPWVNIKGTIEALFLIEVYLKCLPWVNTKVVRIGLLVTKLFWFSITAFSVKVWVYEFCVWYIIKKITLTAVISCAQVKCGVWGNIK